MMAHTQKWIKTHQTGIVHSVQTLLCLTICILAIVILLHEIKIEDKLELLENHLQAQDIRLAKIDADNQQIIERLIVMQEKSDVFYEQYASDIQAIRLQQLPQLQQQAIYEYRQTVYGLQETYDELLAELRKRTVSYSGQDIPLKEKSDLAQEAFQQGLYKKAYDLYSEVITYQNDNFDARFYRIYALFLLNRQDSTKYRQILDEIVLLRRDGYKKADMDEMEAYINREISARR